MRGRFMGLIVSAILSTASVVLFFYPGLNLGIDFSGGIVMEVRTDGPADFTQIRAALAAAAVPNKACSGSAMTSEVLIRLGSQPTEAAPSRRATVRAALERRSSGRPHPAHRRRRRLGLAPNCSATACSPWASAC